MWVSVIIIIITIFAYVILGVRKTLVTGSVPTENLPEKSNEAPKRERRALVRNVDIPNID